MSRVDADHTIMIMYAYGDCTRIISDGSCRRERLLLKYDIVVGCTAVKRLASPAWEEVDPRTVSMWMNVVVVCPKYYSESSFSYAFGERRSENNSKHIPVC
jgi:hypothetical protein